MLRTGGGGASSGAARFLPLPAMVFSVFSVALLGFSANAFRVVAGAIEFERVERVVDWAGFSAARLFVVVIVALTPRLTGATGFVVGFVVGFVEGLVVVVVVVVRAGFCALERMSSSSSESTNPINALALSLDIGTGIWTTLGRYVCSYGDLCTKYV